MILSGFAPLLLALSAFAQQDQPRATADAQANFAIAGVVVDGVSGQLLSQAEVFIQAQGIPDSGQSMMTNDDGSFAFYNLASGHYTLSARRRGYLEQAYKQHEGFSTAIIVGAGQDTSHLRFPLPPEASISGEVTDEMNDPVRQANVILFQRGLRSGRSATWRRAGASTDDRGHYSFTHLLPGTYFVAVSAQPWYAQHDVEIMRRASNPGEVQTEELIIPPDPALDVVYPVTFFSNAPNMADAAPITVRPGEAETADFALHPISALHLTVICDPPGGPDGPGNVWAEVREAVGEGWHEGVSVHSAQIRPGLLEITGLPPGGFDLTLHTSHGKESSVRSVSVHLAEDSKIDFSGAAVNATVSGVIRMDDGVLPARSFIQFRNRNTGEQVGAQVEENGQFVLRGRSLDPGNYDVSANGSGGMAVRSLSATGGKVSGRSLEVAAGQDVKLTVVVSKGTGRVSGVALKDDQPVDEVMVVLVPEVLENNLDLFRRDQSDSDGSFNLAGILPGKYTIIALESGWDLNWYDPTVLQKYLPSGEHVEVAPNAKLQVKVKVQTSFQK
ncbi:MAG TPA: carboxypeptidase-like regulatory domain-containing protein [Candidatus Acidoferrum sp.]|nr:carboxypeptidase-like regulatory domain-containing protein [Candidatus Acidoferrum sp.]